MVLSGAVCLDVEMVVVVPQGWRVCDGEKTRVRIDELTCRYGYGLPEDCFCLRVQSACVSSLLVLQLLRLDGCDCAVWRRSLASAKVDVKQTHARPQGRQKAGRRLFDARASWLHRAAAVAGP